MILDIIREETVSSQEEELKVQQTIETWVRRDVDTTIPIKQPGLRSTTLGQLGPLRRSARPIQLLEYS